MIFQGNKKFRYMCLSVGFMLSFFMLSLNALIVGSKSTPSTQAFTVFPAADTNNTLLGFASFDNGFSLFNNVTTATFDNFMPASGLINLNNGKLVLRQDFFLANQTNIVSGGRVEGNYHAFVLPSQPTIFSLPLGQCYNFVPLTSVNLEPDSLADSRTMDWAFDDNYLATGQRPLSLGTELKLFYFNGTTITTTQSVEIGREVSSVRWHPTQRYLAVGIIAGTGDEIKIYQHKPFNGTFVQTSGAALSGSATAVIWHPSGNYIVIGSDSDTQELLLYPVTSGVLGSAVALNLASNQNVNRDALSFSPGGNQLAVGLTNNITTNISEIMIYNFAATSLTLTTSIDTGASVQCLDWCPSGSYIAAGLTGSANNIRIYDASSGKMRELISSRQVESRDAYTIHWHPSGNYLAVGVDYGVNPELFIYFFDKVNKQLVYLTDLMSGDEVFDLRWSRNGNFLAYAFETVLLQSSVNIATFLASDCKLLFDNTTVMCNSDVAVLGDIHFKGTCRLDGQGNTLFLADGSECIVRPNSTLIIENCHIKRVRGNNIRCMNNSASIRLQDSQLYFDRSFTFSQGSFYCENDVVFSGSQIFNYTSPLTSTIGDNAMLLIDYGTTFKYAPARARRDLLNFESSDACLYLNGCTLHSTRTGLQLSGGVLVIDNNVTLTSEALYPAEGLTIKDALDVQIRGGATLDLYGYITYG